MAGRYNYLLVEYADPIEVFGAVESPDCSYSERAIDTIRRDDAVADKVRYDEALGCLMLTPTYTPADTPLSACTHTSGSWVEAVTTTTKKKVVQQVAGTADTQWSYTHGASPTVAIPDGGGLWLTLGKSTVDPAGTINADHCYVRATLMATSQKGYRIAWPLGSNPRLEQTLDGATWTHKGDIQVFDGDKAASGRPDLIRFQILRCAGKIAFRATVNNSVNQAALTVPDMDLIYPLTVTGMNYKATISHFPITFEASGSLASCPHPKLWANTREPVTSHDGSTAGISVTMRDTGSDWLTAWIAVLSASESNTITPWFRSVHVSIPEIHTDPSPYPTWTALPFVLGASIHHDFSPAEITVRRSGFVVCRNHEGQYRDWRGNWAVRITTWIEWVDDHGVRSLWEPSVRMVGWLGFKTETGTEEWSSSILDRVDYELRQSVGDDIHLDGLCMYHAVRLLAQKAGFTRQWLSDNLPGAPEGAWDCDSVSCIGAAGHLHIGVGTNDNPLYEYSADTSIWDIIQDIARRYGMFAGVDSLGRFEFFPWDPWKARNDWTPKQVFSVGAEYDLEGNPYLNQCLGELVKHVSYEDVRNGVTLIGMTGGTRKPICSHLYDHDSVYGGALEKPANYMGRLRRYVETNARYEDPVSTDYFALRKFQILREPRVWFDPLACVPQPLYPLDYIGIMANRTLSDDDRFYLASVHEDLWTEADNHGVMQHYKMVLYPELIPQGYSA
ncbi:MAG TPA: hypothetical protein VGM51_09540 [Armatimonadota bacterium]|jgi:hypothetical protein